ncbi:MULTISPECIES: hypothetical protein [unclassified Hyphomonas]|uniref:hypothetical protein n=1 Tax=unclassified Hyphomonas TaxID=2630699 RepID=UPI0004590C94|nr:MULTISPECIES: hypothetical protein [unclassified Hyphomonas]KCZ48547.1 hypothetical protein HY17_17005 [Hyphomonas sp. CY54-11-8]
MGSSANFVDANGVNLTCWLDWYDGPVSGLARWQGKDVWFRLASDAGEETRTYEIFDLAPEQVAESLAWFEEKRDWFENRAPRIRKIRRDVADKAEQERLIAAQGLSLRQWTGPEITSNAIARFSDEHMGADWFDSERWCPVQDQQN